MQLRRRISSWPALVLAPVLGFTLLLTGIILLASVPPPSAAASGPPPVVGGGHFQGDGTAANPYLITNRADLDFLAAAINSEVSPDQWAHLRNRHFRMTGHIDLGGQTNPWLVPIGTTARPFIGVFDGGNFAIRNMFRNESANPVVNYGIFGVTSNATIRNLRVENVTVVVAAAISGSSNIAAVVGNATAGTFIENVRAVNGSINASGATSVAGLVGRSAGTSAAAHNRILASSSGITIIGGTEVGGLAGQTISTVMHQTFATGNVTAALSNAIIGGLVASTHTQNSTATTMRDHAVLDSFATGNVSVTATAATGTFAVGGLVGQVHTATTHIRNTYAAGNIMVDTNSGTINVGGLVGLTTGTTAITQSGVVTGIINQTGGTRVIARLAPGAHGATVANNYNNRINSAVTNQLNIGDQFPGAQYPTETAANSHIPRAQFLNRNTWVTMGWNMSWVWDISASVNDGLPFLRTFGEDDSAFVGNGTFDSPWILSTAADLRFLRDTVNTGISFAGRHFRLGGNIVLTEQEWMPIGTTHALGFAGHFDGAGHVIGGLRIHERTTGRTGLFGDILAGASVTNLIIDQPDIRTTTDAAHTGALAGVVHQNVHINNVIARDVSIVSGGNATGGLIGLTSGSGINSQPVNITNVHVTGYVGGRESVGGIVGNALSTQFNLTSFVGDVQREIIGTNSTGSDFGGLTGRSQTNVISNSFVRGNVRDAVDTLNQNNHTTVWVGGLVGRSVAWNNLTINNSYFAGGIVEGKARAGHMVYVGGLLGGMESAANLLFINNSFSAAHQLIGHSTSGWHTVFGWLTAMHGTTNSAVRASARADNTEMIFRNISTGEIETITSTVINPGDPAVVPVSRFMETAFFTAGVALGGMAWDMTSVWQINPLINGGFPFLRVTSPNPETNTNFRGRGTADRPFLIATATELRLMRDLVNHGNPHIDVHFRLENDIDLGGAPWVPIGRAAANWFAGHFDGNHHTVRGLFVNINEANRGLFGMTNNATLRNITIENPMFTMNGGDSTGALVGRADGTLTIDNVHIIGGRVESVGTRVGGIVGQMNATTFTQLLTNSSSSSVVWGGATATGWGGLVGYANATVPHGITISNSFFEGLVRRSTGGIGSSVSGMGGIVGVADGVNIDRVYNAGEVFAPGGMEAVGGIVGTIRSAHASTIRNSYNVGQVASLPAAWSFQGAIGGIVGLAQGGQNLTIQNVFNSGDLRALGNATPHMGGIVGYVANSTSRLSINGAVALGNMYTHQAITSRAWFAQVETAANIPTAQSNNNLFLDTMSMVVNTHFADTTRLIHTGTGTASRTMEQLRTWSTFQNIGWSSAVWTIDPDLNNGLPHLRSVGTPTSDHMTPTANQTQEARTLVIRNLDEFLAFRDRVNLRGESFADRHIRVETDLNLQHIPDWTPIGLNATNPFSGRIDFAGHTISGLRRSASITDFGLFGWVNNGAIIENLYIDTPNISAVSHNHIGVLVGQINNSATIRNVHVIGDGIVRGHGWTGGFIGFIANAIDVNIINTSSTARVTALGVSAGGHTGRAEHIDVPTNAAGVNFQGIRISDSFAAGAVNPPPQASVNTSVGGFIGWMNGGVNIQRSYAAGNVFGTSHVGGFVGDIQGVRNTITDAFALGSVRGSANDLGGFAGRINGHVHFRQVFARGIVYMTSTSGSQHLGGLFGSTHTGVQNFRIEGGAALNPSVSGPAATSNIGRFGTGSALSTVPGLASYPNASRLDTMVIGRIVVANASSIHDETTLSLVNGVRVLSLADYRRWDTWASKGYDENIWQIDPAVNEGLPTLRGLRFDAADFPGNAASPLIISTPGELADFRSRVNEGNNFFGQTIILANDIDMADGPAWLPIGTSTTNFFAGTFDGNGHFIRNMHASNPMANFGFFGFTRGATIRNLGFIDTNVTTVNANAGIVVGTSIAQLTMENVFAVNGRIHSTVNHIGGLVGEVQGTQNVIRRSYVDNVDIQGGQVVGGFVGQASSITVEHSYFDGTVRAITTASTVLRAGGIIGGVGNVAGLARTQIIDVAVGGTVIAGGTMAPGGLIAVTGTSTSVIAAGIIGIDESTTTTQIRNAFINANVFAASNTANNYAVASSMLGRTTQAHSVHIANSVIAGGTIQASGTTRTRMQVYFGTSTMGIGIFTENNRISSTLTRTRIGPEHVQATWDDHLRDGGDTDLTISDPQYFRTLSTYTNLGWNMTSVWVLDPAVNNSLPYLRGMTAVVELLMAVIQYAEGYRGADFSNATFTRLQSEILWARGFLTGSTTIEREELFNVITRVRNAVADLRAEDSHLRALVEFVEVNLVHASSQFVTFAQVDALMRDAEIMLGRTHPDTGDNRVINSVVNQMHNALQTAINNLQIDRTILSNLIMEASILQEHHYTAESWDPFAEALARATSINSQSNPTIDAILNAYSELYALKNSLVLETGRLQQLFDDAMLLSVMTPGIDTAQWPAFTTARDNAFLVLLAANNGTATAAQIATAESQLIQATSNLFNFDPEIRDLRNEINALINTARGLVATQFDPPTWNALQNAVNIALLRLADHEATVTQLTQARDGIATALGNLTMNVQPLRMALNAAQNRLNAARVPVTGSVQYFYGDAGALNTLLNLIDEVGVALQPANLPAMDLDAMNVFINRLENAQDALTLNRQPINSFLNELRALLDPGNRPFYTMESFNALETQIAETESRLGGITRADELVAEFTLLQIARNNLSVNNSMLRDAIDQAERVEQRFVTDVTWTPFVERLAEAREVFANNQATINEVVAATNALNTAFTNLRADGTYVADAVARMTGGVYVDANFRTDSWDVFNTARTAASTAAANANIEVLTLQRIYQELLNAYATLLPNKTVLEQRIDAALLIDAALYNTASIAVLNDAIANAQAVFGDMTSNIYAVLDAIEQINDAIGALVVNTDELQNLIDLVSGLTEAHFVATRWAALMDEVDLAVAFIASNPQSFTDRNARVAALRAALDNLEIEMGALEDLINEAEYILSRETRFTRQSIRELRTALEGALSAAASGTFEEVSAATIVLANAVANVVSIHELVLVRMVAEVFTTEDVNDSTRWAQLQSMIQDVEPLLENGTFSQVALLTNNLRNAILNILNPDHFTTTSWNVYMNELESAFQGISLIPDVPNTIIVRIALDSLVSIVPLLELFEQIDGLDSSVFANWEIVQDLLDQIEDDLLLDHGTRNEIRDMAEALEKAIAELRFDTTALAELITLLNARQAINYTDNSFEILEVAIANAIAVRDALVTQNAETIDAAITALNNARDQLVNIVNIDNVSLKTAIENFFRPIRNAGQSAGETGWTLGSWNDFVTAFSAAEEATRSAPTHAAAMQAFQDLVDAHLGLTPNPAAGVLNPDYLRELQELYDLWIPRTAGEFLSGFGALTIALGNAERVLGIPTDNEGNILINDDDVLGAITQLNNAIGNLVLRPTPLPTVTGIIFDRDTMTIWWNPVTGAEGYRVIINGGAPVTVTTTWINIGTLGLGFGTHTISIIAFTTADNFDDSVPANISIYLPDPGVGPGPQEQLGPVTNITFDQDTMIISWTAVANADAYRVVINGITHIVTTNSFDITNLNLTYGSHSITIVAFSSNIAWLDSEPAARDINLIDPGVGPGPADRLGNVTNISFTQSTMSMTWAAVPNADGYRVTINGTTITVNTNFIDLTPFNLTFGRHTVTIVAFSNDATWLDSDPVNREINITFPGGPTQDDKLDPVENIVFTQGTMTITWDAVDNADGYRVIINGTAHYVTTNQINIAALGLGYGKHTVIVVAISNDETWLDSDPVEREINIIPGTGPGPEDKLDQVGSITFNQDTMTITWVAVDNADGYRVTIGGTTHTVNTNSINITGFGLGFGRHNIIIVAFSNDPSWLDSDPVTREINIVDPGTGPGPDDKLDPVENITFTQSNMRITWDAVDNADGYVVTINGVEHTVSTNFIDIGGLGLVYGRHTISIVATSNDPTWLDSDPVTREINIIDPNEGPGENDRLDQVTGINFVQETMILSWVAVDNADGYRVTIDGTTHVVTTNQINLSIFGLGFGTHTVTIVAFSNDANWLDSNPITRDITLVDTPPPPPPPDQLENVSNITFNQDTMTISWTAVDHADSYTVTINGVEHTVGTNQIYIGGLGLGFGRHTISIVATSTDPEWLDSEPVGREINIIDPNEGPGENDRLDQVANITFNQNTMLITWTAVDNADGYNVIIDGITHRVYTNQINITSLGLGYGDHMITIVAFSNDTTWLDSIAVEHQITIVDPGTGPVPEQLDQVGEITFNQDTMIISWAAIDNATGYRVIINGVTHNVTVSQINITSLGLGFGRHTITIIAHSTDPLWNDSVAAVREIEIIDTTPPPPPLPLDQPQNLRVNAGILEWNAVDGADAYEIFADGLLIGTVTTGTSFDLAAVLLIDRDYLVTIRAIADDRPASIPSAAITFRGEGSVTVEQLDTPENLVIANEILTWDAVTGAGGYQIFINGFYRTTVTGTSFNLAEFPVGEHIITVRAIAIDRLHSEHSASITFTVYAPGPVPGDDPSGFNFMEYLAYILGGAGALILLTSLAVFLMLRRKRGAAGLITAKESARNAINSAFAELQKAGEYIGAADTNPADAAAQETAMAQLSKTDQAMQNAEEALAKFLGMKK